MRQAQSGATGFFPASGFKAEFLKPLEQSDPAVRWRTSCVAFWTPHGLHQVTEFPRKTLNIPSRQALSRRTEIIRRKVNLSKKGRRHEVGVAGIDREKEVTVVNSSFERRQWLPDIAGDGDRRRLVQVR